MIVYSKTKQGFQDDIARGEIDVIIGQYFKEKLNRNIYSKRG